MIAWMEEAKATGYKDGDTTHPYMFMLDSGAFTLQQHADEEDRLGDYAEEYIKWLQTDPAAKVFDLVAELDVAADVYNILGQRTIDGYKRMLKWRDRLSKIVGDKLMPVHHYELDGRPGWASLCRDPRFHYLGISSGLSADYGMQKILMGEGHRAGKWIHAFGMTRLQTDMKYLTRYDSVDSTTWLRADKYGGTFIVRRGSLVILDHKHKHLRKNYRQYFKRIGCNPDKILGIHRDHIMRCPGPDSQTRGCNACRDQLLELRRSSLIAWRNLTYHYERFNEKGFVRTPQYLEDDHGEDASGSSGEARRGDGESAQTSPPQRADKRANPKIVLMSHSLPSRQKGRNQDRVPSVHHQGDNGGMKRVKGKRKKQKAGTSGTERRRDLGGDGPAKRGWGTPTSQSGEAGEGVASKRQEGAPGQYDRRETRGRRAEKEITDDPGSNRESGAKGNDRLSSGNRAGGVLDSRTDRRAEKEGKERGAIHDRGHTNSSSSGGAGQKERGDLVNTRRNDETLQRRRVDDGTKTQRLAGEGNRCVGEINRDNENPVRAKVTSTRAERQTPASTAKRKKGSIIKHGENPRTKPFGGYECPHYRRRPPEIFQNLNCRACKNLDPCANLEGTGDSQRAPKLTVQTEPQAPSTQIGAEGGVEGPELHPIPPASSPSARTVPPLENLQKGAPDYLQPDGALAQHDRTLQEDEDRKSEPQISPPTAQYLPQGGRSEAVREGIVSEMLPITSRMPVVTQGGLNLGALRQGLPRIECSTCAISEDCPKYEPEAVCAFNEIFDQFDTRNSDDLYAVQQMLVELDMDRTMKFVLLERLTTGGVVDPKVTAQMDSLQRRVQMLHEMQVSRSPGGRKDGRPSVHLHHHLPAPVGTEQGGMLTRLFSGPSTEQETPAQKAIDTQAQDKPEE